MTVYNWLCLLGVPALVAGMMKWMSVQFKGVGAIKIGLQAVLRDRLICSYQHCLKAGGATYTERMNFENLYTQYHALGANGVMDDIHAKFLALPYKEEE